MTHDSEPSEALTVARFVQDYAGAALEHPPKLQDAFGNAAREMGLRLRRTSKYRHSVLDRGVVIGQLEHKGSSLNTGEARSIAKRKPEATRYLASAGVPVPEQKQFALSDESEALRFARERNFEVVVKPPAGSGGEGVTVEISREADFRRAWAVVASLPAKAHRGSALVERRHHGIDVRAIVVGGRYVCAITRVPANVIGDGVSSVRRLVELRNEQRARDAYLKRFEIILDAERLTEIAALGVDIESVPAKEERVFLTSVSNIHRGADIFDVTDLLPRSVREIAESAARAIPGLGDSGIDLIVPSLSDGAMPVVIEVNAYPNLHPHYRPYAGQPRDPARAVLEEMRKRAEGRRVWLRLKQGVARLVRKGQRVLRG